MNTLASKDFSTRKGLEIKLKFPYKGSIVSSNISTLLLGITHVKQSDTENYIEYYTLTIPSVLASIEYAVTDITCYVKQNEAEKMLWTAKITNINDKNDFQLIPADVTFI